VYAGKLVRLSGHPVARIELLEACLTGTAMFVESSRSTSRTKNITDDVSVRQLAALRERSPSVLDGAPRV
jgi:hypothetical protein